MLAQERQAQGHDADADEVSGVQQGRVIVCRTRSQESSKAGDVSMRFLCEERGRGKRRKQGLE